MRAGRFISGTASLVNQQIGHLTVTAPLIHMHKHQRIHIHICRHALCVHVCWHLNLFFPFFVIDFEFRSQRATIAIVSQLYCDVTHIHTHAKALQQPILSFSFERIYKKKKKKQTKKIVHKYFSLRLRLLSAVWKRATSALTLTLPLPLLFFLSRVVQTSLAHRKRLQVFP